MSVHEILLGFKDNIQKSRNPFFGTFIVVWVIRNWQFILTLFNLDLYPTMERKVEALKDYFADATLVGSFFWNAFITLGVLIASYVLLNVSKAIALFFQNYVSLWLQDRLDPLSVVPKEQLDMEQRTVTRLKMQLAKSERELNRLSQLLEDVTSDLKLAENESYFEDVVATHRQLEAQALQVRFREIVVEIYSGTELSNAHKEIQMFRDRYGLIEPVHGPGDFGGSTYTLSSYGVRYWLYLVRTRLVANSPK